MNIKIRTALTKDLAALQALFVDTIKNTCKNDYGSEQISAWIASVENKKRWLDVLNMQYVIVAELENKIVGFASLENGQYIDFLYVHKKYLRRGLASLLFENLKKKSVQMGYDKLSSDVSITALPFFKSKGFFVVKENKKVLNGVVITNYKLEQQKMQIRKYHKPSDEKALMKMIEKEEDWDYANKGLWKKYKVALESSITFVALVNNSICGFSRSIIDLDFYVYVCDLLVAPGARGHGIGRKLMECVCLDFPDHIVYVMSDVDGYYEKLGYRREGSLFEVQKH